MYLWYSIFGLINGNTLIQKVCFAFIKGDNFIKMVTYFSTKTLIL